MPISIAYFLCLFLYLVFSFWGQPVAVWPTVRTLLLFLMLLMLGWHVFGTPIRS
jgi:hypothetical protein